MKKNICVLFLAVLILFSAVSTQAEQWTRIGLMTISCTGSHSYFTCPKTGLYRVKAESGAIRWGYNGWTWNRCYWHGRYLDKVVLNGQVWPKTGFFSTQAAAEAYWKGTYKDLNMSGGGKLDIYFSDPDYSDDAGSATVGVYFYGKINIKELAPPIDENAKAGVDPINIVMGHLIIRTIFILHGLLCYNESLIFQ